jgi:pyrroloquinoline quinone biosynthesis protein D
MSTSPAFIDGSIPTIAPGYRFQWEEAQNAFVLLYPEGMVKLNQSAGEVLKRCDGERDVAAVLQDLQAQFPGVDLDADVRKFLEVAFDNGWIRFKQ